MLFQQATVQIMTLHVPHLRQSKNEIIILVDVPLVFHSMLLKTEPTYSHFIWNYHEKKNWEKYKKSGNFVQNLFE